MPIFENREIVFNTLSTIGYTSGSLEDRLYLYLSENGYNIGSLDDRLWSYLKADHNIDLSLPDLTYLGIRLLGPNLWVDPVVMTAGWSYDLDNSYTAINVAAFSGNLITGNVLTVGKKYLFTFEYEVGATGTIRSKAGATIGLTKSVAGIYSSEIICEGALTASLQPTTTFNGGVKGISVREVFNV